MKPIDPRLLRYARATRFFLAAVVVLGALGAGLVVAQAMLLAELIVSSFEQRFDTGDLATPLLLLVAVALGRALVSWLTELAAHRASAAVTSELRMRLVERAGQLGPGWLGGRRTGSLIALATRGVDALDDYFARYLPQLGLAVVVPVAVLARIVTEDWVSAAIIVVTLPLIPLFMALIGWATQSRMDRQWGLLSRLSGHFLDVVAGLPTLKIFGRAKAQAESIRRITHDYRRATLRTLRIAFLSSFALELLATLSVALVAVTIGMRLVHGDIDLYTGLVILVLAPEAYLPLRQVGAQYHAAAEGLAAVEEVFAVLETPVPHTGTQAPPAGALAFEGVTVRYPGRDAPAVREATFTVEPGETVALVGPSGCGKTTLLQAALGFVAPAEGRITVGGTDLAEVDREEWHQRIAWVPQRPQLFAGTVAENVRLARPDASEAEVARALEQAGAREFVAGLPAGAETELGEDGAGLSAGQRQRVALARAFLADRPVLLLDEPTASLDGASEEAVVEAVRRLAAGRTVLLVVHRPALLAVADRVVRLDEVTKVSAGEGERGVPAQRGATVRTPVVSAADSMTVADGPRGVDVSRETRPEEWEWFFSDVSRETTSQPEEPEADVSRETSEAEDTADRRLPGRGSALARVRAAGREGRGRLILSLVLGSLALGSAVGLMATSGYLISRASQQPPVLYLMMAVTATRAFGIGRAVFRYAERLVSHDVVLRMLADTRVAVFRRLERLAPAGLRGTRRGDLLSRLVADVDALQDYWLRWLLPAGWAALVSTVSVLFMTWLLPTAGAVLAIGLLAAAVGVPLVSGGFARRAEGRLAPARGCLATRVAEVLTGTGELTVAGALAHRTARTGDADRELTRIRARGAAANALGAGLTAVITGLTTVAAAYVGIRGVSAGALDGVALAVVVLTPLAAFEAVTALPLAVQFRQRVRRSAERVHEVLDAPVPVTEPEAAGPAPESPFPVELRGVAARHPGQERDALTGIDLTVPEGRRIAVVGPSGSGKTTLAQLLLRFLDPRTGSYTLAGASAPGLDGDDVRRLVGLCAQDAHVFDSTLRENLLLADRSATEARLREVLGRSRLLEWAETLPQGLDTPVGEHGARLSGGQRQRLALARALLAGFPLLVLDEPAEHLDLETADRLTADLLAATRGRTTLLITHRLAGLEAVDEILVLDEGRIVQRGTSEELGAEEGPFRRLRERERATDALLLGRAGVPA
ncbi:ABC transporter [Streptomyces albidoflavus]|uniref:thiol reductant ABC exporter subunit CydD n=1 Tax=Streptomyces albidoflavus TaxID=1886 RepID=UPI000BAE3BE7|nr:thiol reductant ABC exporter subunit CydD [Streptomyces albidoflavus]PAX88971.1 ABC transporter [Streptomyces albidoflavus]PAX90690.1 ABC transporter [Streptomyces albidoflavus]PBO18018.1 ABC transporter [Streptomyces albidoflavus]PBO24379.1 ABC transporter [Streptomyces albidoflavus]PBO27358.1 ABC transporter [Streptomyces albidoflavus]